MIIDRCKTIIEKIDNLEKINQGREQAENLNKRSEELKALNNKIETSLKSYFLMKHNCTNIKSEDIDLVGLKENVLKRKKRVSKAFEQDLVSLTSGRDYANLTSSLQKMSNSVSSNNRNVWKQYVEFLKGSFSGSSVVRNLPVFGNLVDKIEENRRMFDELIRKIPQGQDTFKQLLEIVVEVKILSKKFPVDLPECVNIFLTNARNSAGAPLSMLFENDEVLEWIKENNLMNDFSVRID